MNLKWFKGLDAEEEKRLRGDLAAAKPALRRLQVLLQAEYLETVSAMQKKSNFSLDWKHYQASKIGELNALETLQQLIKE